jgi:hypothetical protein
MTTPESSTQSHEIRRFSGNEDYGCLVVAPNGEWVTYNDHVAAIDARLHALALRHREEVAALRAERDGLRVLVERYASECISCVGYGYVYEGEAITGRGPDDVFPNKVDCAECADIRAALLNATKGEL